VPEPQPQTPQQVLLTELRTALATQRTMFAEDSPRIVALEDRIAALEEQAGTETTAVPVRTGSPAIDLQIAEIDDRLDAIALEKTVIAQTISALDASIKATPANETALNALEREHDNLQTLYNAALERLAEASTGEMIEASFRGERLSLVEAALPPERALRPRRLTIAAAGLAGGMALGLGLVFLVELLQRPLRRPVQLERVLGIEPLATIPYMRTNAQLWRRRLLTAVALTAVVSAWPLLQMLLVNSDLSLASMLSATLGRLEGLVS
jgi:uncharacterized protein involved in exopolysaccharide biosynthesis